MIRLAGVGFALAAASVGGAALVWGRPAVLATSVTALLGVAVHLAAAARVRRFLDDELRGLAGAFVFGMVLRLLGVGVVAVAVTVLDAWFPAGPSLLGYGIVVVPLLFMEIRFLK